MTRYKHIPVLLTEVIHHLRPEPNQVFIDGTVGQGGHAFAIAERISGIAGSGSAGLPGGRLLAMDRDSVNLGIARERLVSFKESVVFVNDSYANLSAIARKHAFDSVDGILLDLGFSSLHIEDATRGFSFMKEGPLDMRYSLKDELTAKIVVNEWYEEDLARTFRVYGEEVRAAEIAKAIVMARRTKSIDTTTQLADLVSGVMKGRGATHPATKVFQALRIVVNDELGELERVLPQCVDLLKVGGRFAIITFHSLEDRIVKNFFKSCTDLEIVTKRPIVPSRLEIKENPRARSAKLRVSIKK